MGLFFSKEQKLLNDLAKQINAHYYDNDPRFLRSLVDEFENSLQIFRKTGRMDDDQIDQYHTNVYIYRKHLNKMEKKAQASSQASIPASQAWMPASPPPAVQAHFCSQCGTPINAGARFCKNCGTPVLQM